jgi:transcriptional regulator with XRE-family HTH domain
VPKSNFTDEYRIFREMLRQLRVDRGVTQAALSAALDMPQSFVSKYEMGERRLDFVELAHICDELGHPLESFVAAYRKATKPTKRKRCPS